VRDLLLSRCIAAKRESKSIEFKAQFSPTDPRDSVELLKDIVAIANSGGGAIAIGLDNVGEPSGADVNAVLLHDHAKYCDHFKKYTRQDFTGFEVVEAKKEEAKVAVFLIEGATSPIVFEQPGTYAIEGGKQKTAFPQGTIYVRHGAKSEAATNEDLRRFLDSRIDAMRKEWSTNLRKVVNAPSGAEVIVEMPSMLTAASEPITNIRLSNAPGALNAIAVSHDLTHPHRQKEVLHTLVGRIPTKVKMNSHDIVAIRKVHRIDEDSRYYYKPLYGSPQYSDLFIEWICERLSEDPDFAGKARASYKGQNQLDPNGG